MRVAAIQMTSGADVDKNLSNSEKLIRSAAEQGATFIATPEVTDQIIAGRAEKIPQHYKQEEHPALLFFSDLAKELEVTLLLGSACIKLSDQKLANRSFLFLPNGELKATYDKIHLYDVDLPTGESHKESNSFEPGKQLVLADLLDFKLGMTICYDMRFPHLFRDLAKAGAEIITVPSAFTVPTGRAHWLSLLRSRAIETGCFIIAPAQVGDHEGARVTYGHSIIISPWGDVMAEASEDRPEFIIADLDLSLVSKSRQAIPSLQHDREYLEILTNSE